MECLKKLRAFRKATTAAEGNRGGIAAKTKFKNKTSEWPSPVNGPCTINGLKYTVHALERMAPKELIQNGREIVSRGIPPTVVEDTIKKGVKKLGRSSKEVVHVFQGVRVVTDKTSTRVITVMKTSG